MATSAPRATTGLRAGDRADVLERGAAARLRLLQESQENARRRQRVAPRAMTRGILHPEVVLERIERTAPKLRQRPSLARKFPWLRY